MSILFAGTPENAAISLRELFRAGVPISLVLTRPDAPIGRKRIITPSPVAEVAAELGIPLVKTNTVDESVISEIERRNITMAVVIAFGVILREPALKALPGGWFNVHYSLLPRWRGAAPVQHAILAGDTETGVTIFKIDEGLDTGDIAGQVSTIIEPVENSSALLKRLTLLGVSLLLEVLPKLESGIITLTKQADQGITLAPKIPRSSAKLSFRSSAAELENLVRATNPEPGAWVAQSTSHDLKIHEAFASSSKDLAPGSCELIDGRVYVGCSKGALELLVVQPSGRERMKSTDWFRGQSLPVMFDENV